MPIKTMIIYLFIVEEQTIKTTTILFLFLTTYQSYFSACGPHTQLEIQNISEQAHYAL